MSTAPSATALQPIRRALVHFGAFAALFAASLWLFPLIALATHRFLPHTAANLLFFWPQLLLAPHGFTLRRTDSATAYWGSQAFPALALLLWLLVASAFSFAVRRRRLRVTLLLTYPFVVCVAAFLAAVLWAFGVTVYLEGP